MKQPEALRIADALSTYSGRFAMLGVCPAAAAELRRLHALNAELVEALGDVMKYVNYATPIADPGFFRIGFEKAGAALSKAKEQP